jgi:hypothetical protein
MSTETNPHPVPKLPDLESRILRALCTTPSPFNSSTKDHASTRTAVLEKLRAHRWQDPEHRVVFEALSLLPGRHSTELREQLPGQATRMGFPDVNWDEYFAASDDYPAIETLVAELLAATPAEKP